MNMFILMTILKAYQYVLTFFCNSFAIQFSFVYFRCLSVHFIPFIYAYVYIFRQRITLISYIGIYVK